MRIALIGLTACWSNPPPKAPPAAPTTTVTAPAEAPAPTPPPAYRLPAQVANALATEALAGQVIVDGDAKLMATEVAARQEPTTRKYAAAIAARVVADHGDVVEIETARVSDCIESFKQPYELRVFVRRDQLVPRAKTEVTKTFADGSAIAIDRGAPIEISSTGLAWSGKLGEITTRPTEDQLAYAVPALATRAALPPQQGERLICDGGSPRTFTEWREERRAKREAEMRVKMEAERVQREAREAEYEKQRAEELRKCKAKAAAAKKKRATNKEKDIGRLFDSDTCAMISLLGSGGYGSGMVLGDAGFGPSLYEEERFAPYCEAVRVGTKYFADVEYSCGRARTVVDEPNGRRVGTGMGMIGGLNDQKVQVWIPKAGPVTWPDGSPAGRYTGRKRYRDVVEIDTRICVTVPGVAEQVCHDKATAKTDMVFSRDIRD